jgi:hypothetical protein
MTTVTLTGEEQLPAWLQNLKKEAQSAKAIALAKRKYGKEIVLPEYRNGGITVQDYRKAVKEYEWAKQDYLKKKQKYLNALAKWRREHAGTVKETGLQPSMRGSTSRGTVPKDHMQGRKQESGGQQSDGCEHCPGVCLLGVCAPSVDGY